MNGKYAKYIENFMKGYKISGENGKNIEVLTDQNPKNKPLIYAKNAEVIEQCNDKLEEQYDIVIKNRDEILKDLIENIREINVGSLILLGISVLVTPALASSFAIIQTYGWISSVILGIITLAIFTGTEIWKNKLLKEMDLIECYKKERSSIQSVMKVDNNVELALSKQAIELLKQKESLVKSNFSTEILDIDFLDKLLDRKYSGKKDLVNLLKMYKAVISMRNIPVYVSPEEAKNNENKSKKRSKNLKEDNSSK